MGKHRLNIVGKPLTALERKERGLTLALSNGGDIDPDRSCGDCTACCEILSIDELEKPDHQKCANLCDKGCAIYEDRPPSCEGYACGWLKGHGELEDRPDKLGVHLHIDGEEPGPVLLRLDEVWRGAASSEAVKDFIKRLNLFERSVVTVWYRNLRREIIGGPPEDVALVRQLPEWQNRNVGAKRRSWKWKR